jgi:peptide deformylase
MFPDPLKIVLYPDPRLKKKSMPVTVFDDALRRLTDGMFELMRKAEGVGLAAPQVGVNLRLFVMNHTKEQLPADDLVVINPVLTVLEGDDEDDDEGCLSIPKIRVNVLRAKHVRLDAVDLDNKPFSITDDDFRARVWQHEVDHLDGILLTDRMGFTEKMRYRKELKKLEGK